MNAPIIIINGFGGVGKDSFINSLRPYYKVTNISFVDKIKESASILGWNSGKTEEDRLFLHKLLLLSIVYNDSPYEHVKKSISYFRKDTPYDCKLMFIHIREPEAIDRVKKDFGCTTLLITNINKPRILSNMEDTNVENYTYDHVIHNDGDLDNLKQQAQEFISQLV